MDATAVGVLAGLGALFFVVGVAGGRAAVAWVPALPGMTRRQALGIGALGVALLLAAVAVAVAGVLGTAGPPTASGPPVPGAGVSATGTAAAPGPGTGDGVRSPGSTGGASYPVHVWWTDDGGATTLHAYDGPDSQHWIATYTYGEALDVTCRTPHGRRVHVGPGYHGPDADSTVWYQLTDGGWIPAAYTNVPATETVPACG
ncbi:hypothetical protein POF50_016245 [Streptomyces sp. SL13]|uniref:Uncharacterized protein n=1 Tax=Streptantibioticus silvisoli TaxID=2705255 RepID=A0AA90KH04_9ACTN|nr:hypothetical protein [Streptantibioticus silvisoli]MDI5964622.1 hypothetical protein [Streptantibioticus silvisoli]MDI5970874.1 hypothetical protein [Streptantibioticus silvisoli]